MELMNLQNFVIIPAVIVAVLYLLNIYFFFQKRNEVSISEEKIAMARVFPYFILFFMLIVAPVIYNIVVFTQIIEKNIAISLQDLYVYGGLWLLGVLLQALVVNRLFSYIATRADRQLIANALTYGILGIALTESFNIFALIYMFQKIGAA